MRVDTPLGAYPFRFSRIERRDEGIAIVGLVAGMESGVVLEPADLVAVARRVGPPLAALAVFAAWRLGRH